MKSERSMDFPPCFGGGVDFPSPGPVHQKRTGSPVPSCVSMKSDQSMGDPISFNEGDSSAGHPIQQKRSPSPVLSCVSMKSERSMDFPPCFGGGIDFPSPGPVHQKRPGSPVPSCVSMKSDQSMGNPISFNEGDSSTGHPIQQKRSPSPVLSCVSMKSERSMDFPPCFGGGVDFPSPGSQSQTNHEGTITSPGTSHQVCVDGALIKNRALSFPEEIQSKLKSYLRTKLQRLSDGSSNPALLSDIYTELYVTEGDAEEINDQHEVREIETACRGTSVAEDTAIKCSDIFTPLAGQHQSIRTVLTKGIAGIGKSVCVQKFALDWAEGTVNQDIKYIFSLSFRELNLITAEKLSISDLLRCFVGDIGDKALLDSWNCNHDTLFIFDGLDECRLPLAFQKNQKLCSPAEAASVDVLLTNLIEGNLLPTALIWITSRPATVGRIPQTCVDRVTVVRGFGDLQKKEYFRKTIRDKTLAEEVIAHIWCMRSLCIMCHIPVFCWISAIVLGRLLEEAECSAIPKNLTQMYTHFIIIQARLEKEKYRLATDKGNQMIFKLAKLAFQQLEKGNLIFYEEDLRECGIDVTEASVYSGVCTQIFREESGLYKGKVYCFVHLTIQEFLAALYVLLHFYSEGSEQHQSLTLSDLFTASSLLDLQMIAVDKALQQPNGNLDLFLRFLLGLCASSLQPDHCPLQFFLPTIKMAPTSSPDVIDYIKTRIMINPLPEQSINLFHCLNELNDHSLVEQIQEYQSSRRLSKVSLPPELWSALVFVLLTSEGSLDVFDLGKYCTRPSDKCLFRMRPVLRESRKAELASCNLTERSCEILGTMIGSQTCHLRELDLSDNYIQDAGVELLSCGIEKPSCRLEKLCLSNCGINMKGCEALMSALNRNPAHLTELDLSNNYPGYNSLALLSVVLAKPCCRIHRLTLVNCNIKHRSCDPLAKALCCKSSSLTTLELSQNSLMDSGVIVLCGGLKDTRCRLNSLRLSNCGLTEESCKALAVALASNPHHLRELLVSYNKHGPACALTAVKLDPQSALQKLKL